MAKKASDKIKLSPLIKILSKLETKETYSNFIKGINNNKEKGKKNLPISQ